MAKCLTDLLSRVALPALFRKNAIYPPSNIWKSEIFSNCLADLLNIAALPALPRKFAIYPPSKFGRLKIYKFLADRLNTAAIYLSLVE